MNISQPRALLAALFTVLALTAPLAQAQEDDPLAAWGITPTTGAAPGYVPDEVCATCHADKAETFADVGMSKSFYRPSADNVIEEFSDTPFFHEPSGRYYLMSLRDGAYWFKRYRLAPDGSQVDVFERRVDWILGSGHHSRIYLIQSDNGILQELPLSWYSQDGKWAMAPGYEFADHPGVTREVPQRCMACHNAFPEVPEGSDQAGMPNLFPADMPEGIGCQRCHGPGAEHVRLALTGEAPLTQVHEAIVQPGKLPREQLYSVCYGCHMQPTVAINSPLRPGRGHYSFRPGEDIQDFLTQIDITDDLRTQGERFDINHHPYRLEQSACFIETADLGEDQLGCLNCHDPHVKIKPPERAAHYRQACLACHTLDDAGQPVPARAEVVHPPITAEDDCTLCHMPRRRTQDVIEVTMTDHKITRDPGPLADLVAPISKIPPQASEVFLLRPGSLPRDEAHLQQLRAVLSHSGPPPEWATESLAELLTRMDLQEAGPWADLARFLMMQRRFGAALDVAQRAYALAPDNPATQMALALALMRNDQSDRAIDMLRALAERWPRMADVHYNLGIALALAGDTDAALQSARRAVTQQDTHWPAWRLTAQLFLRKGDNDRAIDAYLEALRIEPGDPRVRNALRETLITEERLEEAARHALPRP